MARRDRPRRGHMGGAILAAAFFSLAAIVAWFPQFRCQEITVEGLRLIEQGDVLRASDLEIGQHFLSGLGPDIPRWFSLRYGKAEEAILELSPYMKSALVQYVFPSRIRIRVEERVEVAYLSIPDGCVVIDAQSVAVEILQTGVPAGIPVIEGVTITSVVLGQPLLVADEAAVHSAVVIMDAIIKSDNEDARFSLFHSVAGLRAVSADTLYMSVILPASGETLVVRLGSLTNIAEIIEWLRNAIYNGHCNRLGKGVLDLSGTQKVFRPDA